MQLGEIIANTFAAFLLACVLVIVLLVAGKPLWPSREANMVILLSVDAMTTASIRAQSTHPRLPDIVDVKLLQPRPDLFNEAAGTN
ncbi:polymerase [Mesorhizobium sp. USDA-HM6]|nr:polymerase [Mesorhizobium sp. USDA-HM6]